MAKPSVVSRSDPISIQVYRGRLWYRDAMQKALILGYSLMMAASAADAPEASISNGIIEARLYLPDAQNGYYRGTRFDWSGVIYSLRYQGHEYFGTWFERYDPKTHDAITGPVEE